MSAATKGIYWVDGHIRIQNNGSRNIFQLLLNPEFFSVNSSKLKNKVPKNDVADKLLNFYTMHSLRVLMNWIKQNEQKERAK